MTNLEDSTNVIPLAFTKVSAVAPLRPTVSASIDDHDTLSGCKTSGNWPREANPLSLRMHFHFVELLEAWNLNPFKRNNDMATATVDEYAETKGVSRFVFVTKESLEDFLDFYGLDDFVIHKGETIDTPDGSTYWCVHLANSFGKPEAESFLTTYRSAMNTLSAIHDERERAIQTDGGKIGFICVDHFAARETHELMRIRKAREILGAPNERH